MTSREPRAVGRWRRGLLALTAGLLALPVAAAVAAPASAATGLTKTWSASATDTRRPVLIGDRVAVIDNAATDAVRFRSRTDGSPVGPVITLPAGVEARAIAAHGTTGIVVAGTQVGAANTPTDDEVFVAEYATSNGAQIWTKTYGEPPVMGSDIYGSDAARAVALDAAGAAYVASSTWNPVGGIDAVVTKLVPAGATATIPWDLVYDDGSLFDVPMDVAVRGSDVYMVGDTASGVSPFNGWVQRVGTNGAKMQAHKFEGAKYTVGGNASGLSRAAAVEVSGGRVWVAGSLDVDINFSQGYADAFVADFAPNLTGGKLQRFGAPFVDDPSIPMPGIGTGSDAAFDLVVGAHGPVVVGEAGGALGSAPGLGLTAGGSGFLRIGSGATATLYKAPFLTGLAHGPSEIYVAGGKYPGESGAGQRIIARLDAGSTPPPPTKPPTKPPTTPPTSTPGGGGYFLVEDDGDLYGFGTAAAKLKAIDPSARDEAARGATVSSIVKDRAGGTRAVAVEATDDGGGLWIMLADGRILEVGNAPAAPGAPAAAMTKMVAGQPERPAALARLGSGDLWVFTTAGRIVPQFGPLPAAAKAAMAQVLAADLVGPILDAKPTVDGTGAYATGSDGGVFAYNAPFHGSVPAALASIGRSLPDQPVAGVTVDPDGSGYWLVAADGGVFAFAAEFRGALPAIVPFDQLASAVNGMVPFGNGYLLVAGDGGVFNFSNRPFSGSASGLVDTKVVGITPI